MKKLTDERGWIKYNTKKAEQQPAISGFYLVVIQSGSTKPQVVACHYHKPDKCWVWIGRDLLKWERITHWAANAWSTERNGMSLSDIRNSVEKASVVEEAIQTIIRYIGDDPTRDGLKETPIRMVVSWEKMFMGYRWGSGAMPPPSSILKCFSAEEGQHDQLITFDNIPFFSTCEHHLLPFFGKAHIGYIPKKKIVGASKPARLLDIYAKRLTIQERITTSVATDLNTVLEPLGVAVILEATHMCTHARGVNKPGSVMKTSVMLGVFRENPEARQEFLSMVAQRSS